MQPSFSVSLRSLVAIASLIAIPAIAVVGASAPRALRSAKRVFKPIVEPASGENVSSETAPTPESSASTASADAQTSPPQTPATNRDPQPLPARKSPAFWNNDAPPARTVPTEPAHLDERAAGDSATVGDVRQAAYEERESQTAADPQDSPFRLRPTGGRQSNRGAPAEAHSEPSATDAQDGFSVLERRLRELGATQYRLETWGADGGLYRFRCLMAVPERPTHNRYFEATDAEALRAMQRVLAQVERWRGRR